MDRLGVGIIGCGWAGGQHARAYSSLNDVELLAVADVDEGKARSLAGKWGASVWHQDYRKMLDDPKIDAVSICLPHYLHSEVAVELAEAAKHTLCEKPMANNLDEADAMIRAAKKSGVTLMIAENVRFSSVNLKLKELIDDDTIGEIFLARLFRDHKMHEYLRERPWFLDKNRAGGGIWMAGGIHDVDALRMLVGEIRKIALFQARKVLLEMEGDDTIAALLEFNNGAVGVVTESFSTKTLKNVSPHEYPSIFNGSAGTIAVSLDEIRICSEKPGNADTFAKMKVERKDTFVEETRHFIDCIRKGEEPITSGEEERRTLAVVCTGYESLSSGGVPVEVSY